MIKMDFFLKNGIFFVLGLSIIFYAVYGFEITVRYFRVKNRSKDFKKCTGNLLSKHAEHGFRVNDLTGKCEEVESDDIKEVGYSYAETIIIGKQFTKPIDKFDDIFWPISKGIKPGFRFDMHVSIPDWYKLNSLFPDAICIRFSNASHELSITWYRQLNFLSQEQKNDGIIIYFEESELRNGIGVKYDTALVSEEIGSNILKFSVLAQSETVKILFDNHERFTYQLNMTNIHVLHELQVKYTLNELATNVALHGYRIIFE